MLVSPALPWSGNTGGEIIFQNSVSDDDLLLGKVLFTVLNNGSEYNVGVKKVDASLYIEDGTSGYAYKITAVESNRFVLSKDSNCGTAVLQALSELNNYVDEGELNLPVTIQSGTLRIPMTEPITDDAISSLWLLSPEGQVLKPYEGSTWQWNLGSFRIEMYHLEQAADAVVLEWQNGSAEITNVALYK